MYLYIYYVTIYIIIYIYIFYIISYLHRYYINIYIIYLLCTAYRSHDFNGKCAVKQWKSMYHETVFHYIWMVDTFVCPFDLVRIPLETGELNSIPLVRGSRTETEWAAAVCSWECSKKCQQNSVESPGMLRCPYLRTTWRWFSPPFWIGSFKLTTIQVRSVAFPSTLAIFVATSVLSLFCAINWRI